jgi:hypothetical protein
MPCQLSNVTACPDDDTTAGCPWVVQKPRGARIILMALPLDHPQIFLTARHHEPRSAVQFVSAHQEPGIVLIGASTGRRQAALMADRRAAITGARGLESPPIHSLLADESPSCVDLRQICLFMYRITTRMVHFGLLARRFATWHSCWLGRTRRKRVACSASQLRDSSAEYMSAFTPTT